MSPSKPKGGERWGGGAGPRTRPSPSRDSMTVTARSKLSAQTHGACASNAPPGPHPLLSWGSQVVTMYANDAGESGPNRALVPARAREWPLQPLPAVVQGRPLVQGGGPVAPLTGRGCRGAAHRSSLCQAAPQPAAQRPAEGAQEGSCGGNAEEAPSLTRTQRSAVGGWQPGRGGMAARRRPGRCGSRRLESLAIL